MHAQEAMLYDEKADVRKDVVVEAFRPKIGVSTKEGYIITHVHYIQELKHRNLIGTAVSTLCL